MLGDKCDLWKGRQSSPDMLLGQNFFADAIFKSTIAIFLLVSFVKLVCLLLLLCYVIFSVLGHEQTFSVAI
jgi:hypothetical protein